MKRIKDKIQRRVKFLRVSYGQSDKWDRQYLGLCAFTLVVFVWWWWFVVVV
jgi:hypothetical protein